VGENPRGWGGAAGGVGGGGEGGGREDGKNDAAVAPEDDDNDRMLVTHSEPADDLTVATKSPIGTRTYPKESVVAAIMIAFDQLADVAVGEDASVGVRGGGEGGGREDGKNDAAVTPNDDDDDDGTEASTRTTCCRWGRNDVSRGTDVSVPSSLSIVDKVKEATTRSKSNEEVKLGSRGMGHNNDAYVCDLGGNGENTSHITNTDTREDNDATVDEADTAAMMRADSFDHTINTDPGEDNAVVLLQKWDIVLNFHTHYGTKVLREYIKGKTALLNFPFLEKEEQDIILDQIIVHFKTVGRFLVYDDLLMGYRTVEDAEVSTALRTWFELNESEDGKLIRSLAYPDFLQDNPDLNDKIIDVFDDLFISESKKPSTPGPGICLTADSTYGDTPTLNIHRKSYLRQMFGRDNTTIQSGDPDTVHCFTYGTGSGRVTHGIQSR
jgi:hypothetical protein